MKLEVIDSKNLTLDDAIRQQYSLYYIVENPDNSIMPYRFLSFSKEGLALPKDKYVLVKLTKDIEEAKPVEEPIVVKPVGAGVSRTYKFNGVNESETIRVSFTPHGAKHGGIRVSFKNKEDARIYYDYFREQFYNRDVSYISIPSIYEDLGFSKERIQEECPDAWKWGYLTLKNGGLCKYMTDVRKNHNDNWFGFTLMPPIIVNGMEESGWYAKHKELDAVS